MTGQTTIRPLTPGDVHLLVQATLGNLNWQEQRFTEQDVKSRSEFRHYTELDAARGDFGFVAEAPVRESEPHGLSSCLPLTLDTDSSMTPLPRSASGCVKTGVSRAWERVCCVDCKQQRGLEGFPASASRSEPTTTPSVSTLPRASWRWQDANGMGSWFGRLDTGWSTARMKLWTAENRVVDRGE